MKSDDGRPELESPVFTVCTLNVGGRNTNSFEFEMRGDVTELGEQWGQRFAKANACLAEAGPSTCQGLERAVDAAYAQMASEPRSTESVVTSLLNDATWEQALERVTRDCPMLFNAAICVAASGATASLEMPKLASSRPTQSPASRVLWCFHFGWTRGHLTMAWLFRV